jgi:hypothetical protein
MNRILIRTGFLLLVLVPFRGPLFAQQDQQTPTLDPVALLGELRGVSIEELRDKDFGPDCPAETACILGDRFNVTVRYKNQHDGGAEGVGHPLSFSDQSALFWFFKDTNIELIVKTLDGRKLNGHYWVFYGGLTDVELFITVTDTETGELKTYHSEPGEICGGSDNTAFAGD